MFFRCFKRHRGLLQTSKFPLFSSTHYFVPEETRTADHKLRPSSAMQVSDSREDLIEVVHEVEKPTSDPYEGLKNRCFGICYPLSAVHRFAVFSLICLLTFGNYFCYDTPSSLQSVIETDMELNNEQFGLLYSVYSWPNVFLSFLGGYMIDQCLGVRLGAIIFASFVAAGQLVFAVGAYTNLLTIMVLGRFIFAIGGESLAVAQNTYTVKWFKDREINTVFGIQLSFSRLGSTINQLTMLKIYESMRGPGTTGHQAIGKVLFIAFLTAVSSWVCGLLLQYFDRRRDRALKVEINRTFQRRREALESAENKPKISLRDILNFPPTFWLLCVLCVTFYAAVFPLVSFGQLFYVNKFGLDPYTASICNSLIYFISIPASIVGGITVDYFGRNVMFMLISVTVALIGHALLAFTFMTPFVPVVMIGCALSLLASSLWPSVAYVVPENAMGTAYGVMQSIQNLGLGLLFILIGLIVDNWGYLILEIVFITLLSGSLTICFLLYFVDEAFDGILSMEASYR